MTRLFPVLLLAILTQLHPTGESWLLGSNELYQDPPIKGYHEHSGPNLEHYCFRPEPLVGGLTYQPGEEMCSEPNEALEMHNADGLDGAPYDSLSIAMPWSPETSRSTEGIRVDPNIYQPTPCRNLNWDSTYTDDFLQLLSPANGSEAILYGDLEPHYSFQISRKADGTLEVIERDSPVMAFSVKLPVDLRSESIENMRIVDPTVPGGIRVQPGLPPDLSNEQLGALAHERWTCVGETDQTGCWR